MAEPIRNGPLFVVGHARSGTTALHRAVAHAKTRRYASLTLGEMLLAPSVTGRVLLAAAGRFDAAALRGAGRAAVGALDRWLLAGPTSRAGHRFSLFAAEEDEWLLAHAAASQQLRLLFPRGAPGVLGLGDDDDDRDDGARWGFYAACVKRHLYYHRRVAKTADPDCVFVSKNPAFTLALRSLARAFPDARFAVAVREPRHAVASALAYRTALARLCGGAPFAAADRAAVVDAAPAMYALPPWRLRLLPRARYASVAFDALRGDPDGAVGSLCARLGLPAATGAGQDHAGTVRPRERDAAAAEVEARLASNPITAAKFKCAAEVLAQLPGEPRLSEEAALRLLPASALPELTGTMAAYVHANLAASRAPPEVAVDRLVRDFNNGLHGLPGTRQGTRQAAARQAVMAML